MAHRGEGLDDVYDNNLKVAKRLITNEGTIHETPVNNLDIVNKKYVDDEITDNAWLKSVDQTGLTGDKSGSFHLTSTGVFNADAYYIKNDARNYLWAAGLGDPIWNVDTNDFFKYNRSSNSWAMSMSGTTEYTFSPTELNCDANNITTTGIGTFESQVITGIVNVTQLGESATAEINFNVDVDEDIKLNFKENSVLTGTFLYDTSASAMEFANYVDSPSANMNLYTRNTKRLVITGYGDLQLLGDNIEMFWGSSQDCSIQYNGTDMLINPKLVGSGKVVVQGNQVIGSNYTSNPAANLTVAGSDYDAYRIKCTSSAFNADTRWLGLGFGYSNNYMKAGILAEAKNGSARCNLHFCLEDGTSSTNANLTDSRMVITYGGDVGIGTTSPNAKIDFGNPLPGVNTPINYILGSAANVNWPVGISQIYDASSVDTWMTFNCNLTGGTYTAPTFKGGTTNGYAIHSYHDSSKNELRFVTIPSGTGTSPTTRMTLDGSGNVDVVGDFTAGTIQADDGWTGSFTNGDGDTVTVTGGIITDVS